MTIECDVAVVGGGPAGLATSIHCARAGLRTVLYDGRRPPIDKACGEGILAPGLAALERLGILPGELSGRPITGVRYRCEWPEIEVEGSFPAGFTGLGVRRTTLHAILVSEAESAGVDLRWGCRVSAILKPGIETDGGPVRARWVVGADGLHSNIRSWAGFQAQGAGTRRFGVRRHFRGARAMKHVEVWWADGCEAYLTPVDDDEFGVALLWRETDQARTTGFDDLMIRFPELRERLAGLPVVSEDRGAGPFRQRVKSVRRGFIALVGDAAGYVDAITGEGLGIAFREAEVLSRAVVAGDLSGYAAASAAIRRQPERLTRFLLFAERYPGIRDRFLNMLQDRPDLFQSLLAVHCGARPIRSLGVFDLARLASLPLAVFRAR